MLKLIAGSRLDFVGGGGSSTRFRISLDGVFCLLSSRMACEQGR